MVSPVITKLSSYAGRLDPAQLSPGVRHYNQAICLFRGDLLCAYRYQNEDGISRVGICKLDEKFSASRNVAVDIPAGYRTHVEDPRLIAIKGVLHLFVAVVTYSKDFAFIMRAFRLDDQTWQPAGELPLPYGQNNKGKTEKNWMPFESPEGVLHFIYQVAPGFAVVNTETGVMRQEPISHLKDWRWGSINGRTNAVHLGDDQFITLVGGHVPHERRKSIYWSAALRFERTATGHYRPTKISRSPFLWASTLTPAILNPFDPNWNPAVVFPAGLVLEADGRLLVSLGTNDSYCDFLRLNIGDLDATMVDVDDITGFEPSNDSTELTPASGLIRVRVRCNQPVGEPGGPYVKGQKFLTTPERLSALGVMVEVVQ